MTGDDLVDCDVCESRHPVDQHTQEGEVVSVVDATLDELVSNASKPNLATLFQRAKDKGLITPVHGYSSVA